MNRLTAYRTFGKPGYTPTKHVRIFQDRFYLVTMQNTEHDQGDGYYLAEGEYTELLHGVEAKRRRDAHLNHCNNIQEYHGPIWEFKQEYRNTEWYASEADVVKRIECLNAEFVNQQSKTAKSADYYHQMQDREAIINNAKRTGVGIDCLKTPEDTDTYVTKEIAWYKRTEEGVRKALARAKPNSYTVEKIRK